MFSRNRMLLGVSLVMTVFSIAARAEFACLTFSRGILFRADEPSESVSRSRVVQACLDHPATSDAECRNNVNCFEQILQNTEIKTVLGSPLR